MCPAYVFTYPFSALPTRKPVFPPVDPSIHTVADQSARPLDSTRPHVSVALSPPSCLQDGSLPVLHLSRPLAHPTSRRSVFALAYQPACQSFIPTAKLYTDPPAHPPVRMFFISPIHLTSPLLSRQPASASPGPRINPPACRPTRPPTNPPAHSQTNQPA